jgi:hypothetical protein
MLSGLGHLFIDYFPLNYRKRLNELFFYDGSRDSDDFKRKRSDIFKAASFFDQQVYFFKTHHRSAGPLVAKSYFAIFCPMAGPALLLIAIAIAVLIDAPHQAASQYAAFTLLIVSLGVAHNDHVHSWVHGSKTMPLGVKAVRFLQKWRLIYSNQTHNRHHQQGESGFCFITGHANFVVDFICRLLLKLNVIHKHHWHGEREPR